METNSCFVPRPIRKLLPSMSFTCFKPGSPSNSLHEVKGQARRARRESMEPRSDRSYSADIVNLILISIMFQEDPILKLTSVSEEIWLLYSC